MRELQTIAHFRFGRGEYGYAIYVIVVVIIAVVAVVVAPATK